MVSTKKYLFIFILILIFVISLFFSNFLIKFIQNSRYEKYSSYTTHLISSVNNSPIYFVKKTKLKNEDLFVYKMVGKINSVSRINKEINLEYNGKTYIFIFSSEAQELNYYNTKGPNSEIYKDSEHPLNIGDSITINWTSTKSISDIIKNYKSEPSAPINENDAFIMITKNNDSII